MKKVIFFLAIIFWQKVSISQPVDTSFVFYPVIVKNLIKTKTLDSIVLKTNYILIRKDTINNRTLNVAIKNMNGKLIEAGQYKLDTVHAIYNYVYNRSGDLVEKRIRKLEYKYMREGYWRNYRGKRINETYYSDGKKVKMKIK